MADEQDWPAYGVDFEKGEITTPASPDPAEDTEFDRFADDETPQTATPKARAQEPGRTAPESIPKYRFDDINQQLQASREREQQLLALVQNVTQQRAALQQQGPAQPAAPKTPEQEQRERVRQQLLEVFPELNDYLKVKDKLPTLISASEEIPRLQHETKQYWGRVADTTLKAIHQELGTHLGTTVDPTSRLGRTTAQAFFEYVAGDQSRVQRYEAQDRTLLPEFISLFDKEMLAPVRTRQQVAQRHETTRRLPVAGRTSPPPSAPTPKPDANDEDAVFKAAWDHVQNGRQALTP